MSLTTTTTTHYTCRGSVRGCCGVAHRTLEAAARCCLDDSRAVHRGHGGSAYSDRLPRVVLTDGERGLTQDERDSVDALLALRVR